MGRSSLCGVLEKERAWWQALADLLPADQAAEVMDCWSIGEQEAALTVIIETLVELDVPITEDARARLAVTAELWGERHFWEDEINRRRSADADSADGPAVRVLTGVAPIPESEPDEVLVVPWIECVRCGEVLARAHTRQWGALSFLPLHFVLNRQGEPARVFADDALEEAFAALTSCAGEGA